MPGTGKFKIYSYRILLAISSLNGILSSLLAPLYWIKAFNNRDDKELFIQALILSTGAVIQIIFILTRPNHAERDILSNIGVFGWITVIRSLGRTFSAEFSELLYNVTKTTGSIPIDRKLFSVLGSLLSIFWITTIGILGYKLRKQIGINLLASYALLFIFSSVFGIGGPDNTLFLIPGKGDRYFFVPATLLLTALLSSI